MTLREWLNHGGWSPAYLYPDDNPNAHYIPKSEYTKLMDCEVDLTKDDDFDEEGHNYAVVWGFVTLPSNIYSYPETGLIDVLY